MERNYEVSIETNGAMEFLLKVIKDKKMYLIRVIFTGDGVDVDVYSVPHNIIPPSFDGCNSYESYLWEGNGHLEQSKFLKISPNFRDNLWDNPWVGFYVRGLIEEL